MNKIIKWIAERLWLISILIGISLITLRLIYSELLPGQLSLGCIFILFGAFIEILRMHD